MYKNSILLALAILIPGLIFVTLHLPQGGIHKTFSQHVALKKSSIYYYFALFLIVLPILYLFFAKYLVPTLNLPDVALGLIALSCFTQLTCTIVPETGGLKTRIHLILAGVSALSLTLVLLYVLVSDNVSGFDKSIVAICNFLMISIAGFVIFWKKSILPALLLQAGYFALFFIAILFVTY